MQRCVVQPRDQVCVQHHRRHLVRPAFGGVEVEGLGSGLWGLDFGIWGLEFGVQGVGFGV